MSAATTALFQLESRGMRELIKKLQPTVRTSSRWLRSSNPVLCSRAWSTILSIESTVNAAIEYPHPDLEPFSNPPTASFLPRTSDADSSGSRRLFSWWCQRLRRAMGRRSPKDEATKHLHDGAGARCRQGVAKGIFDLMEKLLDTV